MENERTNLSEFSISTAFAAVQVSLQLEHCRDSRAKVLKELARLKVGDAASLQISTVNANSSGSSEGLLLNDDIFGVYGEPIAIEAYNKLVSRVLDALDDYLSAAVIEKEKELLRDFNIDPHR